MVENWEKSVLGVGSPEYEEMCVNSMKLEGALCVIFKRPMRKANHYFQGFFVSRITALTSVDQNVHLQGTIYLVINNRGIFIV